jgi:hypothetical protein
VPREIVVITPVPVTTEELLLAAQEVDPTLRFRQVGGGAVVQLVDDAGSQPVLSVQQPSALRVPSEIERLLPAGSVPAPVRAAVVAAAESGEAVWLEALAPFDARGAVGVAVARRLAARLDGACVVQDGR